MTVLIYNLYNEECNMASSFYTIGTTAEELHQL